MRAYQKESFSFRFRFAKFAKSFLLDKNGLPQQTFFSAPQNTLSSRRLDVAAGLIDEFRFTINPVVIVAGTPIFKGLGRPLKLELIKTRKFGSGNVMQYYRPKK
jgi:hypothetical protein